MRHTQTYTRIRMENIMRKSIIPKNNSYAISTHNIGFNEGTKFSQIIFITHRKRTYLSYCVRGDLAEPRDDDLHKDVICVLLCVRTYD